jgi:hypothetical protein
MPGPCWWDDSTLHIRSGSSEPHRERAEYAPTDTPIAVDVTARSWIQVTVSISPALRLTRPNGSSSRSIVQRTRRPIEAARGSTRYRAPVRRGAGRACPRAARRWRKRVHVPPSAVDLDAGIAPPESGQPRFPRSRSHHEGIPYALRGPVKSQCTRSRLRPSDRRRILRALSTEIPRGTSYVPITLLLPPCCMCWLRGLGGRRPGRSR